MSKLKTPQQEIKDKLKDVHDTTTMVKRFASLLKAHETDTTDYLRAFKASYGEYHYYSKVKEAITTEMEVLGMDTDHVSDIL